MLHSKRSRILAFSFLIVALVTTSVGGAFANSALAAAPETEMQAINETTAADKTVLGGLAALGLLAIIAGRGDKSDRSDASQSNNAGVVPSIPTNTQTTTQAQTQSPTQTQIQPQTQTQIQPQTQTQAQTQSYGLTADETQAFNLLNADRKARGLPALKINMQLVKLAENYAQDMINRKFFSHYNPEGQSPFDRMRQYGISYRYAGENLAINRSVAGAEQAFMNSAGHRANILSPNYTEVGIGVRRDSNGSVYVVQEFIGK